MSKILSPPNASVAYSLFYAGQFVLLGLQLPFLGGWLAGRNFSAADIGVVTGIALIARLVIGPAVAFWADHQLDERKALKRVSFIFALSAAALALAPGKAATALAAISVTTIFGVILPLTDTTVLRADRNGFLHYGRIRAIGSACFLAATIFGGVVVAKWGLDAAIYGMAIAAGTTIVAAYLLPAGAGARDGERPVSWREAPQLLAAPVFLAVALSAGLTQSAHAVYYAFSYLRWEALGYSPMIIGLLWATGVIAEIFVLAGGREIARRFAPMLLLGAAGLTAVLRWSITAMEPPLAILFLAQLMHAGTYSFAYLGAIEFLDRAVPVRLINTSMTLISTAGIGALTGLATIAAGFIWREAGPAAAYWAMAALGAAAAAVAFLVSRVWNGDRLFA